MIVNIIMYALLAFAGFVLVGTISFKIISYRRATRLQRDVKRFAKLQRKYATKK